MNKSLAAFVLACLAASLTGCGMFGPPGAQPPAGTPVPGPAARTPAPAQPPAPRRVEPVPQTPPAAEVRSEPRPEARSSGSSNESSTESEQMSNLIAYVQQVAALHLEEQRRELSGATQAFAREASLLARLRLALLLGTPGLQVADDARALALLEPVAAVPAPAQATQPGGLLRRLAAWLHAQVSERVREQRRTAQLREQLDALKAMERNLLERGQGRRR